MMKKSAALMALALVCLYSLASSADVITYTEDAIVNADFNNQPTHSIEIRMLVYTPASGAPSCGTNFFCYEGFGSLYIDGFYEGTLGAYGGAGYPACLPFCTLFFPLTVFVDQTYHPEPEAGFYLGNNTNSMRTYWLTTRNANFSSYQLGNHFLQTGNPDPNYTSFTITSDLVTLYVTDIIGQTTFTATGVPEPSSFATLGGALLSFLLFLSLTKRTLRLPIITL
jgi:hypothetical protein